jgi:hypothetical protein
LELKPHEDATNNEVSTSIDREERRAGNIPMGVASVCRCALAGKADSSL